MNDWRLQSEFIPQHAHTAGMIKRESAYELERAERAHGVGHVDQRVAMRTGGCHPGQFP